MRMLSRDSASSNDDQLNPVTSINVNQAEQLNSQMSLEKRRSLFRSVELEALKSKLYEQVMDSLQAQQSEDHLQCAQQQLRQLLRATIRATWRQTLNAIEPEGVAEDLQAAAAIEPVPSEDHQPAVNLALDSQQHNLDPGLVKLFQHQDTSHAQVQIDIDSVPAKTMHSRPPRKLSKAELLHQKAVQIWESNLQYICQQLRQVRQAQGISIMQLHQKTLVPIMHLKSIEAENLERLPEPIYIKGFVHRIGDALGLDGKAIAACLTVPQSAESMAPPWNSRKSKGAYSTNGAPIYLGSLPIYLGYSALVAGAVSGISWLAQQDAADNLPKQALSRAYQLDVVSAKASGAIHTPGLAATPRGTNAEIAPVGQDITPPESLPQANR